MPNVHTTIVQIYNFTESGHSTCSKFSNKSIEAILDTAGNIVVYGNNSDFPKKCLNQYSSEENNKTNYKISTAKYNNCDNYRTLQRQKPFEVAKIEESLSLLPRQVYPTVQDVNEENVSCNSSESENYKSKNILGKLYVISL